MSLKAAKMLRKCKESTYSKISWQPMKMAEALKDTILFMRTINFL